MEKQPLERRFWGKVEIDRPDNCWRWRATPDARGYGHFTIGKRAHLAHRIMWQVFHGEPAPRDMAVCHSCDNPICVNPNHLWLGSWGDNIRDCVAKGRHASTTQSRLIRELRARIAELEGTPA